MCTGTSDTPPEREEADMKTARLKRKLLAWDRYERRLEKLGQTRIYDASIHYLARNVLRRARSMNEIGWNWKEQP